MDDQTASTLRKGDLLELSDEYLNQPHANNFKGQRQFTYLRTTKDKRCLVVTKLGNKNQETYHKDFLKRI